MAALKIVPLLSRETCFRLAGFAGSLAATLDRSGRRVALSNLELAFGDGFSPERRSRIVRESYQDFARTMLDLFWSPRLNAQNFRHYIVFEGLEQMRIDTDPERSCIAGAFHYGNVEWLGLACGWIGFASSIVTEEFKKSLARSILSRSARTIRTQNCPARRRDRSALQNSTKERAGCVTRGRDAAAASTDGGDRVFRFEDHGDCGACVASETYRRADHPDLLRAIGSRSLSCCGATEGGDSRRRNASGNRAGLLGRVRAGRAEKSRALALDVQVLALQTTSGAARVSVLLARMFGV